jgi:DNA-directed RNA polymerase specialized sigma24 family protein
MTDQNQRGFMRLLAWFGGDEAEATDKLEQVRRDLASFLRRRGLKHQDIDDLVQDVVLTTASKCAGPELPPYPAPELLMFGIVRKLLLQHFQQQTRGAEASDVERVHDSTTSAVLRWPFAESDEALCLERALAELTRDERKLLLHYFDANEWERSDLATGLGVQRTALRVRVFRLKQQLHARILRCLEGLVRPRAV